MSGFIIFPSTKFKKDYKKYLKKKNELTGIQNTISLLSQNGTDSIPKEMKPHKLIGNYKGCWECHISPDLLLIWQQEEQVNEITLIRVGTHSDLFK